jgi:hypothetical protein
MFSVACAPGTVEMLLASGANFPGRGTAADCAQAPAPEANKPAAPKPLKKERRCAYMCGGVISLGTGW